MKFLPVSILILLCAIPASGVRFDELDKPPEGAHRGQMLLGAFATVGVPYGKIIGAEQGFIRNSTYTFSDNLVTKKIMLRHLSFSYGLSFEYMPVDHMGLMVKGRRSIIVQTTMFGSQYQNWSRLLYSDYTVIFGPSIHVTTRRQWDIAFTPFAGYSFGEYSAAPIAKELIYNFRRPTSIQMIFGYAGKRDKRVNSPIVGTEANILLYFSGGFFLSLGAEWTMNIIEFSGRYYLMNTQTYVWFFGNRKSSHLHSISFIVSGGYAFLN